MQFWHISLFLFFFFHFTARGGWRGQRNRQRNKWNESLWSQLLNSTPRFSRPAFDQFYFILFNWTLPILEVAMITTQQIKSLKRKRRCSRRCCSQILPFLLLFLLHLLPVPALDLSHRWARDIICWQYNLQVCRHFDDCVIFLWNL